VLAKVDCHRDDAKETVIGPIRGIVATIPLSKRMLAPFLKENDADQEREYSSQRNNRNRKLLFLERYLRTRRG
jgi:hypothetical protein